MKIVIYDTQHYEMVNVLLNIFDSDENQILFLVDTKIKSKMESHPITNSRIMRYDFVVEGNQPTKDFFSEAERKVMALKPDLMIFNTIDKDYSLMWKLIKKLPFPYLITIHNLNTWLKPPFTLNRKALANYYYRGKMVKKSSFLAVQEELFIDYIRKNSLYGKPVVTIPHTLQEEKPNQPENTKIRIAIPGGIDGVRRDNDFALDVIEEINKVSKNFQFVFLGKVVGHLGEKIWDRIISLREKGMDIQHFYDDNSNVVFDTEMNRCDLVFLPLNVNTKYEGVPEVYGISKVTGVIYDMMRFAKPGVVPEKMVIPPTMGGSLLSYNSKEQLIRILLEWGENPQITKERKWIAEENSRYYTGENIRNRVLFFLDQELKKGKINK